MQTIENNELYKIAKQYLSLVEAIDSISIEEFLVKANQSLLSMCALWIDLPESKSTYATSYQAGYKKELCKTFKKKLFVELKEKSRFWSIDFPLDRKGARQIAFPDRFWDIYILLDEPLALYKKDKKQNDKKLLASWKDNFVDFGLLDNIIETLRPINMLFDELNIERITSTTSKPTVQKSIVERQYTESKTPFEHLPYLTSPIEKERVKSLHGFEICDYIFGLLLAPQSDDTFLRKAPELIVNMWSLQLFAMESASGGIENYFDKVDPIYLPHLLHALEKIGSLKSLQLIKAAIPLAMTDETLGIFEYQDDKMLSSYAIQDKYHDLSNDFDEIYDIIDNELYECISKYIKNNF